jgi:hypothetical protein
MGGGAAVNLLRATLQESEAPRDGRWQARFDDIPNLVTSAQEKYGTADDGGQTQTADATIIQVGEWVRNLFANSSPDPLVEDGYGGEIIGRAQQGILYGPTGTFKTAIGNELMFAVSTGCGMGRQALTDMALFRAQKGRVLSAVYEDKRDYARRMQAIAKARNVNLDDLDWAVVSTEFNITVPKDRAELLRRIAVDASKHGPPALLVIDTAAAAVGTLSLNDDETAGMLFAISQPLAGIYSCTTVFIAHPGKDLERGIAGSYRLRGNSDFILKTVALKDRRWRLLKDKDRSGAVRPLFDYTGAFIEVDRTSSGLPRTGAIIGTMLLAPQQDGYPQHGGKAPKTRSRSLRILLTALEKALAAHGKPIESSPGATVQAVERSFVQAEFIKAWGGEPDAKNRAVKRALAAALEQDLVESREIDGVDMLWLGSDDD